MRALFLPFACIVIASISTVSCTPAAPLSDERIDFFEFSRDQPALAGDWYLYQEEAGHILTPLEHTYIVREMQDDAFRYAAVQVESYYDPDTAESGVFTLRVSTFEDGAFVALNVWQTPKNIKLDGPLCIDLFAQEEKDCAQNDWQLVLKTYPFLALEGPIVVNRPGIFVRSSIEGAPDEVRIASLQAVRALSAVDPFSIEELNDVERELFDTPSQRFDKFAVSFPKDGLVLGTLSDIAEQNVLFLDGANGLYKARFTLNSNEELSIEYSQAAFDTRSQVAEAFAASETTTLPLPLNEGEISAFNFSEGQAMAAFGSLSLLSDALAPTRYSFALVRSANETQVILSSKNAARFSRDNFEDVKVPTLSESAQ